MSNNKRLVLIAGVHGVSGRAAAEHWSAKPDTEVYGLSRRSAPVPEGVHPISVDLMTPSDVQQTLSSLHGLTHIVFGAYVEKQSAAEKSTVNVAIMRNLLDAR
jgi:nucleoside-diphosphate-sugar epimerase